jgi:hypothetical protein
MTTRAVAGDAHQQRLPHGGRGGAARFKNDPPPPATKQTTGSVNAMYDTRVKTGCVAIPMRAGAQSQRHGQTWVSVDQNKRKTTTGGYHRCAVGARERSTPGAGSSTASALISKPPQAKSKKNCFLFSNFVLIQATCLDGVLTPTPERKADGEAGAEGGRGRERVP